MMAWFGRRRTDWAEVLPTPVGRLCHWCQEPIADDDDGFMITSLEVQEHGPLWQQKDVPIHYYCQLRSIGGSLAHQTRACSCFVKDGAMHDPPGLTVRQAAEQAGRYLEAHPPRIRGVTAFAGRTEEDDDLTPSSIE